MDINQEQSQPHGTGQLVGERLIELIRERTKLGIEKHGEPLTTHNGRDAMLDALQESIDLNQYLMQALMESEEQLTQPESEPALVWEELPPGRYRQVLAGGVINPIQIEHNGRDVILQRLVPEAEKRNYSDSPSQVERLLHDERRKD